MEETKYIATLCNKRGKPFYTGPAMDDRVEAAKEAMRRFDNAKIASTCRASLIDGEYKALGFNTQWHSRHALFPAQ